MSKRKKVTVLSQTALMSARYRKLAERAGAARVWATFDGDSSEPKHLILGEVGDGESMVIDLIPGNIKVTTIDQGSVPVLIETFELDLGLTVQPVLRADDQDGPCRP